MNKDQPYLTADLYLVAFLCLEGMTLIGVTPEMEGPRKFILVDRDDRDDLVELWLTSSGNGGLARNYAAKLRMVKKTLYGNKNA